MGGGILEDGGILRGGVLAAGFVSLVLIREVKGGGAFASAASIGADPPAVDAVTAGWADRGWKHFMSAELGLGCHPGRGQGRRGH